MEKKSLTQLSTEDPIFIEIFDKICSDNPKVVEKITISNGKPLQKALNKLRNELISKSNKRISIEDAEFVIFQRFNKP